MFTHNIKDGKRLVEDRSPSPPGRNETRRCLCQSVELSSQCACALVRAGTCIRSCLVVVFRRRHGRRHARLRPVSLPQERALRFRGKRRLARRGYLADDGADHHAEKARAGHPRLHSRGSVPGAATGSSSGVHARYRRESHVLACLRRLLSSGLRYRNAACVSSMPTKASPQDIAYMRETGNVPDDWARA